MSPKLGFDLLKFFKPKSKPGGPGSKKVPSKKDGPSKKKTDKDTGEGGITTGKVVKGGAGIGGLTAAGYLGSKFSQMFGKKQALEAGRNIAGSLGGLTPTGMMGGMGMSGSMFGGGGVVQTAPETVGISPGKSVLEQILGVLIQIKQDTSTLLNTAEASAESSSRARESMEAAQAESKTEGSRLGLSSIGNALTSIPSGIQKGLTGLGKGLSVLFAADVLRKLFLGDDDKKEKETKSGLPVEPMANPMRSFIGEDIGGVGSYLESLKPSVKRMFNGIKNAIFAGTPGHEESKVGESVQEFIQGVGDFFDNALPISALADAFPGVFGPDGKLVDVSNFSFAKMLGYFFGQPGQESKFLKDIKFNELIENIKEFGKTEFEKSKIIPATIKAFQDAGEFLDEADVKVREKVTQARQDFEKKIVNIFDVIGAQFQKIKDFFSLNNLKNYLPDFIANKIGTEKQSELPVEPISKTQPSKEIINDEIKKAILSDEAGFDKNLAQKAVVKTGFVPNLEDLSEAQQATILKRAENTQRQKLEAQGVEVEPKQRSKLEKDPFQNQIGNQMRYNGADPKPIVMAMNQITTPTTVEQNDMSQQTQQNVSIKNESGGDGGIGTRNKDASLYSGISVPPAHTSSYY